MTYRISERGRIGAAHLRPGELPLVLSYGAGVHSFALAVGIFKERTPFWRGLRRRLAMIIHSDLGAEWPATRDHLRNVAKPFFERHGFPLTVIRPQVRDRHGSVHEDIYDYYMSQGCIPTRKNLSCSTRFKVIPCQDATADLLGEAVTMIGYHAGEAKRTANLPAELLPTRQFPLFQQELDHDACEGLIQKHGLPTPPKSACHFCMNSRVGEMELLCEVHPELMERNIALEENMHRERGRSDITLLSLSQRRLQERYWERRASGYFERKAAKQAAAQANRRAG